MTVTLNLPPDVERAFQGEAQARGLSVDEFLSEVVLSRVEHVAGQSAGAAPLSVQLVREEGVPVLRTGQPIRISVVDETLDRIRRERESAILGRSNGSCFSIPPFWCLFSGRTPPPRPESPPLHTMRPGHRVLRFSQSGRGLFHPDAAPAATSGYTGSGYRVSGKYP